MKPSESLSIDGDRSVRVSNDEDDESLGACLYLSPEELRALGIDLEAVDKLVFSINRESGTLSVEGVTE